MKKFFIYILIFNAGFLFAQYEDKNFSIGVGYNYTTSSKIFLNPNAVDVFDQNQYFDIGDFQNYSFDLRYKLSDFIIIGMSAEYLSNSEKGRNLSSPLFIVDDGFEIFPIELSIYYFLPFSTESFKFFFGGGLGFYLGNRTRNFGNIHFEKIDSEFGYGIQVSSGMDYLILDNISLRGEIRFRDPDFKVTNKYNSKTVLYEGNTYSVSSNNLISRINIDGITFRIGAAFHF